MVSNRRNGIYRSVFAALVGIALLFVGLSIYGYLDSVSNAFQSQAANASKHYAENADKHVRNACSRAAKISQPDCAHQAQQTARENQRAEQDLAAQKITAWWTKVMGVAALIGMALSAVGVFLVYITFYETRKSNSIAKDAMIADNRAWVNLDFDHRELWFSRDEITMDVIVRAENIGHSVALDVRCWGEIYIGHSELLPVSRTPG